MPLDTYKLDLKYSVNEWNVNPSSHKLSKLKLDGYSVY